MNALNWYFWEELPEVVDEIENDKDIKVAVFYSDVKDFSIGLDIFDFGEKFQDLIFSNDKQKLYETIKVMQKGMDRIEQGKKVYISAINGYCIGGALDFIAACDLRFCSEDAIFSLRETKLGIVADMGSLQRLPFIIGFGNLKYLAFTGKDFDAKKAYEISLVSEVFEKQKLFEESLKIAKEIADNPYETVAGCKYIINNIIKDDITNSLEDVAMFNKENLNFMKVISRFTENRKGGRK
jgi:enoyl-CoA hydratase